MYICHKGRQWLTPTNGINWIISRVPHLSLPSTFYFIFQFYHSPPARSSNIYHILYNILFEIHRHQPFNQFFFFFFGFVEKTFITVLMLRIMLFLFIIIIGFFLGFYSFYRIISISTLRIIFIITWSIFSFRIIILCLVS